VDDPNKTARPVTFFLGLMILFVGLFITLGSLLHNHLEVLTNDTSSQVYGPMDWTAAIIGAVVLLVGIILLMFSKVAATESS
jgi:choline-glycine betaine transporter